MRGASSTTAKAILLALAVLGPIGSGPARAEPWLVLPTHDASGSTQLLFWVDLAYGGTFAADPRRGGGVLRLRRLEQNLFTTIGRRQDAPAALGQFLLGPIRSGNGETQALLLAEADTGYMALLTRLDRGNQMGELQTLSGRPGAPLATGDGNYLLLMRRDARGRTDGAYLIHGTSGGCVLLEGLERLQDQPTSRRCPSLTSFQAASDAAALETSDGATTGYLLAVGERGTLLRISLAAEDGGGLMVTATDLHLGELFGAGEEAGPRRYALAPIRTEGGGTRSVLVADSATGRLALLRGLADTTPTVRLLTRDLRNALSRGGRTLALIPRLSAFSTTQGVWALDPSANRAFLIEDPESDRETRIEAVEIRR